MSEQVGAHLRPSLLRGKNIVSGVIIVTSFARRLSCSNYAIMLATERISPRDALVRQLEARPTAEWVDSSTDFNFDLPRRD
jgi:hypothetical protein